MLQEHVWPQVVVKLKKTMVIFVKECAPLQVKTVLVEFLKNTLDENRVIIRCRISGLRILLT